MYDGLAIVGGGVRFVVMRDCNARHVLKMLAGELID